MSNKVYSYGKQSIDAEDIQSVIDVLKSDWLTQGPTIERFERALCNYLKAEHAAIVCNGTAALHLTALALGWRKGDIILTTPITFLASANCIVYAGAIPDFVDIDAKSYTIDVNKIEDKIKLYRKRGKTVKAIIAVDFAGQPCDWDGLMTLKEKYNLQLVNDNCHALGAKYKDDVGYAVLYADAVCSSFHPVKHITTGEGGAVISNDKDLIEKIQMLRTHGITKKQELLEKFDGPWFYEMHTLGYNYRITDFQCALGISQLAKLERFISEREKIALFYNQVFKGDERFLIPSVRQHSRHAYHLYPLQINFEKIKIL